MGFNRTASNSGSKVKSSDRISREQSHCTQIDYKHTRSPSGLHLEHFNASRCQYSDEYEFCLVLSRDSDEESFALDPVPKSEDLNCGPTASTEKLPIISRKISSNDGAFDKLVSEKLKNRTTNSSKDSDSPSAPSSLRMIKPSLSALGAANKAINNVNTATSVRSPQRRTHEIPALQSYRSTRVYKSTPHPKKMLSALGNEGNELLYSSSEESDTSSTVRRHTFPKFVSALGNVLPRNSIRVSSTSNRLPRNFAFSNSDDDFSHECPPELEVGLDVSPIQHVGLNQERLLENSSVVSGKCDYICEGLANVRTKLNFGTDVNRPVSAMQCAQESPAACSTQKENDTSNQSKRDALSKSDLNDSFHSARNCIPSRESSSEKKEVRNSLHENTQGCSLQSATTVQGQAAADKPPRKQKSPASLQRTRARKGKPTRTDRYRQSNVNSPGSRSTDTLQDNDQRPKTVSSLERSESLIAEVDSMSARSSCNTLSQKGNLSFTSANLIAGAHNKAQLSGKRRNTSDDEGAPNTRKRRKQTKVHVNCLKPSLLFEIYSFLNQFSHVGKYGKQTAVLKQRLEGAMPCLALQRVSANEWPRACNHQPCGHEQAQRISNGSDRHVGRGSVSDHQCGNVHSLPGQQRNVGTEKYNETHKQHTQTADCPNAIHEGHVQSGDCRNASRKGYTQVADCHLVDSSEAFNRSAGDSKRNAGEDVATEPQKSADDEDNTVRKKSGSNVNSEVAGKSSAKSARPTGRLRKPRKEGVTKRKPKVSVPHPSLKMSKNKPSETRSKHPHSHEHAEDAYNCNEDAYNCNEDAYNCNDHLMETEANFDRGDTSQSWSGENSNSKATNTQSKQKTGPVEVDIPDRFHVGSARSREDVAPQRSSSTENSGKRNRKGSGDKNNVDTGLPIRKSGRYRVPTGYEVKTNELGEKCLVRKDSGILEPLFLTVRERRRLEKENLISRLPRKSVNKVQKRRARGNIVERASSSVVRKTDKRQLYNSREWMDSEVVRNMFID